MKAANGHSAKHLLEKKVKDYQGAHVYLAGNAYYNWRRKPPFHRMFHVPAMLQDSRLQMSMQILKGMITSLSRFYVDEGSAEGDQPSEIKQFLIDQISHFWRIGSYRCLSAMEWGWFGAETLYRVNDKGQFVFDDFNTFRQPDTYPVTLDGDFVGMEVRDKAEPIYIGGQKAFWHLHWRDQNKWWGGSRLRGAFEPWLDLHDEWGALDVRRQYYYKHVFQGEIIRHPPGSTQDKNGNPVAYDKIARSLVEKARAGGVYVLPSVYDPASKKPLWDVEDRATQSSADDVREYVSDCRREMTEGVGLSEEIFKAAESGSGYSGRKIPETATRGMLTDIVYWIISDADSQIFRPLIKMNFGCNPEYEIIPFGLVGSEEDDDVHAVQDYHTGKVPDSAAKKAAGKDEKGQMRLAV